MMAVLLIQDEVYVGFHNAGRRMLSIVGPSSLLFTSFNSLMKFDAFGYRYHSR
jgi:hypothetical protein